MTESIGRRAFLVQTSGLVLMAGSLSDQGSAQAQRGNLTELSAAAAVAAMRRGEITAEAYARALLDRAQRLERLNAFRVLDADRVLEAARQADKGRASGARLGTLHGLPIPVKDSVNTAALATTNGTRALSAFRPRADAPVLTSLLAQGAIVMGKTNLHELSLGATSNNLTFGAVHNPYDPVRVPGGSSGGSAVAVASRMAPLAVAEDTLGSIRIPSTMCGICGLRPTFGRYPDEGIMPLTEGKFDQVGPVARSVEDLALFDSVVTGDTSALEAVPLQNVRLGVPDFLLTDLDPEVDRVVSAAFERLRAAGVTLVRADVSDAVKASMQVALTIILYEVVAAISGFLDSQNTGVSFAQLLESAGADIQAILKTAAQAPGRPARERYDAALAQRQQIKDDIAAYVARHDVAALVFPPVMIPPPKIGEDTIVPIAGKTIALLTAVSRGTSPGSCASLASLVLPTGMTSGGLPVGLEFDVLPGADRKLLALGLSLQKALGPIPPPTVG